MATASFSRRGRDPRISPLNPRIRCGQRARCPVPLSAGARHRLSENPNWPQRRGLKNPPEAGCIPRSKLKQIGRQALKSTRQGRPVCRKCLSDLIEAQHYCGDRHSRSHGNLGCRHAATAKSVQAEANAVVCGGEGAHGNLAVRFDTQFHLDEDGRLTYLGVDVNVHGGRTKVTRRNARLLICRQPGSNPSFAWLKIAV